MPYLQLYLRTPARLLQQWSSTARLPFMAANLHSRDHPYLLILFAHSAQHLSSQCWDGRTNLATAGDCSHARRLLRTTVSADDEEVCVIKWPRGIIADYFISMPGGPMRQFRKETDLLPEPQPLENSTFLSNLGHGYGDGYVCTYSEERKIYRNVCNS